MRNLPFVKDIRIKNKWLFEELQTKSDLLEQHSKLKKYLEETDQALVYEENREIINNNTYVILPKKYNLNKEELIQRKKQIILTGVEVERELEYCRNRIRFYKKIAKIRIPLG